MHVCLAIVWAAIPEDNAKGAVINEPMKILVWYPEPIKEADMLGIVKNKIN